jgi:plastocyanin
VEKKNMEKFRRSLFVSFALLAGFLALAACGGGATPAPANISVTATDFHFDPQTWTVTAGQTVNVTLINKGALPHDFVVIKAGETVTPPFDDDDAGKVFWKLHSENGETATGSFTAPDAPGTYTVVCDVLGHMEAGMVASLVVQ